MAERPAAMGHNNAAEKRHIQIEDPNQQVIQECDQTCRSTLEVQQYHRYQDNHFSLRVPSDNFLSLFFSARNTIKTIYNANLFKTNRLQKQFAIIC